MRTLLLAFLSLTLVASLSTSSFAEICIKIDETKDNLNAGERLATQALLEAGFIKAGESVTSEGCANTYTLVNIRLGKSITTIVDGPKGNRRLQVERIEELGAVYEQIAYSLVHGTKLGDTASQGVNRNNITAKQALPNRVESDSLIHVSFGSGLIIGANPDSVPINLGLSYRYELDHFGIDFGGSMLFIPGEGDDKAALAQASLSGLYFFNGEANHSSFAGAGLGLSSMGISQDDFDYSGGGMHARAMIGYEFLRASTIRFSVQADLTIPFYSAEVNPESDSDQMTPEEKSLYAPILGITLGGAYTNPANSTRKSIVRVY